MSPWWPLSCDTVIVSCNQISQKSWCFSSKDNLCFCSQSFHWLNLRAEEKTCLKCFFYVTLPAICNCQKLKRFGPFTLEEQHPLLFSPYFPWNLAAHNVQCSVEADFALLSPSFTRLQKFYKCFADSNDFSVLHCCMYKTNTKVDLLPFLQTLLLFSAYSSNVCFLLHRFGAGETSNGPTTMTCMSWGHELLLELFLFTSHLRVQLSNANSCRTERDQLQLKTFSGHTTNLPSNWEHPKHLCLSKCFYIRADKHNTSCLFCLAMTTAVSVICCRVISLR